MTACPTASWFDYPIRVHPQQTDYAGIAWHGSYLGWLEAARIEQLRSYGVGFETLVSMDCDLPVVEMKLRYHQALPLGTAALVRSRFNAVKGVRVIWDQHIESCDRTLCYMTAQITVVALSRSTGKLLRRPPAQLMDVLNRAGSDGRE